MGFKDFFVCFIEIVYEQIQKTFINSNVDTGKKTINKLKIATMRNLFII